MNQPNPPRFTRTCAHCGVGFGANNNNAKYCHLCRVIVKKLQGRTATINAAGNCAVCGDKLGSTRSTLCKIHAQKGPYAGKSQGVNTAHKRILVDLNTTAERIKKEYERRIGKSAISQV